MTVALRFIILAVIVLFAACGPPPEDEWVTAAPMAGEHSLLVVFREDTPPQKVFEVLTEVLAIPRGKTGHDLFPGVRSAVGAGVHGHSAAVFAFRTSSTPQQRSALEHAAKTEPAILVVLADTSPDTISVEQLQTLANGVN